MLHFHGLEYRNGVAHKYSYRINFTEAIEQLHNYLQQNSHYDQPPSATSFIAELNAKIDDLYIGNQNKKLYKGWNSRLQHLFLLRNIAYFWSANTRINELLIKIFDCLASHDELKIKWQHLQQILLVNEGLLDTKLEQQLLDEHSLLNGILMFIRLCFLDQINELPPTNLKLVFINNKFPEHNWISTDITNNLHRNDWIAKEPICGLNFMRFSLLQVKQQLSSALVGKESRLAVLPANHNLPVVIDQTADFEESEIMLSHNNRSGQDHTQLQLFDQRPWETMQVFSDYILKKYGLSGQQIFFAILRQLGKCDRRQKFFSFEIEKLLKAFGLEKKTKNIKKKFIVKCFDILSEFKFLHVIRVQSDKNLIKKNSLLNIWGYSDLDQNYGDQDFLQAKKWLIFLDDIFYPNYKKNWLALGSPFELLPIVFFRLKIPLSLRDLPKLLHYISTRWLHDYDSNKGRLSDSVKNLIYGSNIFVAKSSKYRVVYKLQAMIRYMQDNQLIEAYRFIESPNKNSWEGIYEINALPETMTWLQQIRSRHMVNNGKLQIDS